MNLVELYDIVIQAQSLNGVPLSNGHVYVYALGRTRLMDTWSDVAGESLNTNPVILDNAGQAKIYVSDAFDYTLVFTDEYDNEIFSVDKYLLSQGAHSHADVAVAPSESIAVSSYNVGEVTVYVPYLTGKLGKVYTGIEPIVVNNVEDKISANHVPLGVQDPLYFVQDDEEGCIIGISGGTVPEGTMNESALGFENDKITGYNGSAFSAGNEYEAGDYISIDNNTISVVNLPTSADVQNIVDVATSGLMPSGDYLTKESADTLYAPTGNYLTGLPEDLVYTADITGLATTAQLDEKLDKADSANFLLTSDSANFLLTSDSAKFYPMESNPSGYLTAHQSLAGYATEQWVEDKGYLTAVDIPESAVWNATTQTVSANSAQWAGGTANPQIPVTGINGIKISESGDKVVFEVSGDYATTAQLAEKQDSLSYSYHDTAISSIDESALYDTSAHAHINTLAGRISDLSSNKLDSAIYANDSGSFLTDIPDTYLQNTDLTIVDNKITEISGVPLSAVSDIFWAVYGTTTYEDTLSAYNAGKKIFVYENGNVWPLIQKGGNPDTFSFTKIIDAWSNGGPKMQYMILSVRDGWYKSNNYPLQADWNETYDYFPAYIKNKPDLTQYQTTAEMTAYQEAGDYYSASNPSGFITAVPDTYLQNTDLSTTDGKVTAISGIPLSAGGDVPEGVMVESGLEYNAVNEISGYNGSAIAQYGAEKQWLVHDDTLVHAANSAQYALGVNLSAVAQLLGVDETVLWSGTLASGSTAALTESITAFEKIGFAGYCHNGVGYSVYGEAPVISNVVRIAAATFWPGSPEFDMVKCECTDTTAKSWGTSILYNGSTNNVSGTITKIVGIGRKQ